MSGRERDPEGEEPSPELERALERLRPSGARPEFAERLRREFVAGELAERTGATTAASPRARRWIPWAIAAGILLVVLPFLLPTRPDPTWVVLDPPAGGSLQVDGELVPFAEDSALAAALEKALRVETPQAPIRLRLRNQLVLELAAGSSLRVENTDTEVLGSPSPIELELERGSLAVVTSSGLGTSRLEILTAQAVVAVTGTAFAVDVVPGMGTCVCCSAGSIVVRSRLGEAPAATVNAGGNAFVFTDGKLRTGEPVPEHLVPIEGLLPLR
ncbi:MAG TPA: FecR domain-containing protein [Planctomycetota bacterium]|nr:FecR domain-containing protein [Planctomycetota bacterium]